MPDDQKPAMASVSVRWSVIAGGCAVVAVAAITGLVILAAVKKVDTLSAIALSLAIVAFMTQIMVFIAQTWSTSQLNAETRSFLAELRTRSQGTESLLNKQVDKLTDDLMGRAAAARKQASSPVEARALVRRDVERALSGSGPVADATTMVDNFRQHQYSARQMDPAETERIAKRLTTFPPVDEAQPLRETFSRLPPPAVGQLARFARDAYEVFHERTGVPGFPAAGGPTTAQKPLIDAGLLEDITKRAGVTNPLGGNMPWLKLTDKGLEVARLLLSNDPSEDESSPQHEWSSESHSPESGGG